MNNFGFHYSIQNSKGKAVFAESVSGTRIGPILEHIAKTVYEHDQKLKGAAVKVVSFRLAEGKEIVDESKLESLTTMVLLAMEHYNQRAGKLVIETLDSSEIRIKKNLKETKKLIEKCWKGYKRVPGTKALTKGSCEKVNELELPSLEVGDTLLVGKFKNRKAEIKGFDTDDNGQPIAKTTKGNQKIFRPRIQKLMPVKEAKKDGFWDEESQKEPDMKGWMSPKGIPHLLDDEHSINQHPDITKHIKNIKSENARTNAALKLGYTRFGHRNGEHYIHYDDMHPQGRQSAIHALNYMNPKGIAHITIEDSPWKKKISPESTHTFFKQSDALRHLKRK